MKPVDVVIPTANLSLAERAVECLKPMMGDLIENVVIVMRNGPEFTAQVERGWRGSSADYILFLNDDAFLSRKALERMLEAIAAPLVGAVGPSMPCRSPQAYSSRPRIPTTKAVPVLVGTCLLVKRVALEDIGGWDLAYTLFSSDYDLAFRLIDNGWLLVWVEDAWVNHIGRTTCRTLSPEELKQLAEHDEGLLEERFPNRVHDQVRRFIEYQRTVLEREGLCTSR